MIIKCVPKFPSMVGTTAPHGKHVIEYVSSGADIVFCQYTKDYSTMRVRRYLVVKTGVFYASIDSAVRAFVRQNT